MTKPIILGTTDEVTACDCCGKSPLKYTVIVEVDGEVLHYGSVCATRHTGMKTGEINSALRARHAEARKVACTAYRQSDEYRAEAARFALRSTMNMMPGKEAALFVRDARLAADAVRKTLAEKFGLSMWEVA